MKVISLNKAMFREYNDIKLNRLLYKQKNLQPLENASSLKVRTRDARLIARTCSSTLTVSGGSTGMGWTREPMPPLFKLCPPPLPSLNYSPIQLIINKHLNNL